MRRKEWIAALAGLVGGVLFNLVIYRHRPRVPKPARCPSYCVTTQAGAGETTCHVVPATLAFDGTLWYCRVEGPGGAP